MEGTTIAALMFPALFLLIFLGLPIAFSLIVVAFAAGWTIWGGEVLPKQMVGRVLGITSVYVLVAVPLFVFMGAVLERSGIAVRLFQALQLWFGRLPGGLALTTISMAAIFAASAGIVGAVEAVIGLMAIPAMMRYSYDKGLIAGTICAGGSLGTIIPPSIIVIVYGSIAQLSVGQLFAGILIPGGLMFLFFLLYIVARTMLRPQDGPRLSREEMAVPFAQKVQVTVVSLVPAVLLIAAVLGSIFAGVASPTEAAGVGAVGALVLALAYGQLNWRMLAEVMKKTLRINSMILLIVFGGAMFTSVFYVHGGGRLVSTIINAYDLGPGGIVALFLFITFVLGFVLEWISIVLICLPIFDPILSAAGVDPILFAVMMLVVIQTSYLTPPMAPAIFYLRAIAPPEITYRDMFAGVLPFVGVQALVLLVVVLFPWVGTYLPAIVAGR